MKLNHLYILTLLFLVVASGCKKNNQVYFPNIGFEEYVYLNNPSSFAITAPGGYIYHTGGYRGLIIYRNNLNGTSSDFSVFDRACPEHFDQGCSKLEVTDDGLYAKCSCGGEKYFILDGSPIEDATRPLHQYPAILNGDVLYISN